MPITRRIYVSLPADPWLSDNLNRLKWGIVEEIEKLGYTPEIFTNPRGKRGLASARSWHPRDADEIARRCTGAAVLGIARWKLQTLDDKPVPVLLPTEFNYYEGALARTLGLPTLVLVQSDVRPRVVFDMNFAGYLGLFDSDADLGLQEPLYLVGDRRRPAAVAEKDVHPLLERVLPVPERHQKLLGMQPPISSIRTSPRWRKRSASRASASRTRKTSMNG